MGNPGISPIGTGPSSVLDSTPKFKSNAPEASGKRKGELEIEKITIEGSTSRLGGSGYLDKGAYLDSIRIYKGIELPRNIKKDVCREKYFGPVQTKIRKDWEGVKKKYDDKIKKISQERDDLIVKKAMAEAKFFREDRSLSPDERAKRKDEIRAMGDQIRELDKRKAKLEKEYSKSIPKILQEVAQKNTGQSHLNSKDFKEIVLVPSSF